MPSSRKKDDDVEEIHQHNFGFQVHDLSQQRCGCGTLLVSQKEFDRRVEEWEAFYDYQRQTPGALRYFKLREAWETHDLETVKKLAQEASEALKKDDYENITPKYPDPTSGISKYVIEEEWEEGEISPLDRVRNFV